MKNKTKQIQLTICKADTSTDITLPMPESSISAGFPSPADDYIELSIDLNKELITHPSSTFFGRVKGYSMKDAGIEEGDILVIDKSLSPKSGSVAVCFIDGEFTVKRLKNIKNNLYLIPENPEFKPLKITNDNNFQVWGIVTYVIKKM